MLIFYVHKTVKDTENKITFYAASGTPAGFK